jgi:hypothetical protein
MKGRSFYGLQDFGRISEYVCASLAPPHPHINLKSYPPDEQFIPLNLRGSILSETRGYIPEICKKTNVHIRLHRDLKDDARVVFSSIKLHCHFLYISKELYYQL